MAVAFVVAGGIVENPVEVVIHVSAIINTVGITCLSSTELIEPPRLLPLPLRLLEPIVGIAHVGLVVLLLAPPRPPIVALLTGRQACSPACTTHLLLALLLLQLPLDIISRLCPPAWLVVRARGGIAAPESVLCALRGPLGLGRSAS